MTKPKTKKQKWSGLLERIIKDYSDSNIQLKLYDEYRKIIAYNFDHLNQSYNSDYFVASTHKWFSSYTLILLRKHLKPAWNSKDIKKRKSDEISMSNLLHDIYIEAHKKNGELSRDTFKKERKKMHENEFAGKELDNKVSEDEKEIFEQFARAGESHFNPCLIYNHYEKLKDELNKIERFTDSIIAHTDSEKWKDSETPIIGDLKEGLVEFRCILKKYALFFNIAIPVSLLEGIVGNWKCIFTEALSIPPRKIKTMKRLK